MIRRITSLSNAEILAADKKRQKIIGQLADVDGQLRTLNRSKRELHFTAAVSLVAPPIVKADAAERLTETSARIAVLTNKRRMIAKGI